MGDPNLAALAAVQLEPAHPAVCPASEDPSANQRLRIHVPRIATSMTMGYEAAPGAMRPEDGGGPSYRGFGVKTDGHIFMDAQESAHLQAKSGLVLQSQNSTLAAAAGTDALVYAARNTLLAGGGNTVIAGGIAHGSVVNEPPSSGHPGDPAWLSQITNAVSQVESTWSTVDTVAAVIETAVPAIQAVFRSAVADWTFLKQWRWWTQGVLSSWGGNWGAHIPMEAGAQAVGAGAEDGTIVYGKGGLILGSERSAGLFSVIGTTVASATGAGITAPWVGITGGDQVEICAAGTDGSFIARRNLELVGGKNVELGARTGNLSMTGKAIIIGSANGNGSKAATNGIALVGQKIAVGAKKNLSVSSPKLSIHADQAGISADKLTLGNGAAVGIAADDIGLRAKNNVALGTEGFYLNVGASSLSFGNVNKPVPAYPARRPPDLEARLKLLASDTPMSELRTIEMNEENAWIDEQMAWIDQVGELQSKNCSIELKDGDIQLEVHGFKMKIDSTKTAIGGALKIKK